MVEQRMAGRRPRIAALALGPGLAAGCPIDVPEVATGLVSASDGPAATGTSPGSEGTTGAPLDDTAAPAVCGDAVIEGGEQCDCGGGPCDLEGLGGKACADVDDPEAPGPLTGGVLDCDPATCTFVTTACTACGDGEVAGVEDCEPPGAALPVTCPELGAGAAGEVACTDHCRYDTSGCTECGASFDFERCPDGWVVVQLHPEAAPPSWACGLVEPGVGPGPYPQGLWGTGLDGPYADDEASGLRSPPIVLRGCTHEALEIRVRHFMSFESAGPVVTDGGNLAVSDDPDAGFVVLAPVAGTLYDAGGLATSYSPPDGQAGWNGHDPDEDAWTESRFRLEGFAAYDPLYLRLQFGSDGSGTADGWFIDRVELREVP